MTFSDSRIAKMLKEDFIPVWEAVAPVRTVTFDLGEGRKIKGSVSGEIAIYFCNRQGKVFDILPALQSPAATLNAMKEAKRFHSKLSKINIDDPKKDYAFLTELQNFHNTRMKSIAASKYDILLKNGAKITKQLAKIDAKTIFPDSEKGEKRRDSYINAATDQATRDLRVMARSKVLIIPPVNEKGEIIDNSITVVEPGGRGYYLWKIGQVFHNVYPLGYDPRDTKVTNKTPIMTPTEWKKMLFEGIFKQKLKGGEVKYNSDSLEAISIFEE